MSHWREGQKQRIKYLLADIEVEFVSIYSNGITSKVYEIGKQSLDLVIGYSPENDLYAAWNPYLHQHRNGVYQLSCSLNASNLKKVDSSVYYSQYSQLNDGQSNYEKKVIIRSQHIEWFCRNWYDIMQPDTLDEKYHHNVVWADRYNTLITRWDKYSENTKVTTERRRELITRYKRYWHFREGILQAYDFRCAICRCDIESLLEAAHINAVKDNGDDDISNGICLCANHHRMFDKHLFDFNASTGGIIIHDDRLKRMDWYETFMQQYQGKIATPAY